MSCETRKIRSVLVGCGRIATLHTKGYENHPDAELYGVFDTDVKKAETFAKQHGIGKVFRSYDEVLEDKTVDAVEILVPHHLHCEMAVKACKAKKHVSVQKPMAMNLSQCDEMIRAARENGVRLKVFENFVFYPPYQFAKKMLDEGEIGEPLFIRYKMNNGGLGSASIPGADKKAKKFGMDKTGWEVGVGSWIWRLNDTLSGGGPFIFDDGYHKFSIIMHMMGSVEKVFAWIDCSQVMPGIYQDCPAAVIWKHRDGKKYGVMEVVDSKDMYIQSNYYTCDERMEITGTRGVLWVTRCTAAMLPQVAPVLMYRDGKLNEYWDMPVDWSESFKNSTLDFIDAVKNNREPVLSGECGREVLKFSLCAMESSAKKQEIYLDSFEDRKLKRKKGVWNIFGKR